MFDEGRYRCLIRAQEFTEPKQKPDGGMGNPAFHLRIEPLWKYTKEGSETCEQFERSIYLPLSDATINGDGLNPGWVLQTLRYLGWGGTSFKELDPGTPGFTSFIDREVDCDVKHEEYGGKTRERWNINRGMAPVESRPTVAKQLDALFGKMLKQTAVKALPPVPAITDSDVEPAQPASTELPPTPAPGKRRGKKTEMVPANTGAFGKDEDIPF